MTEGVHVHTAMGEAEAQQVRSFLRSNGIDCRFEGEALRTVHGFTLNGLGEVRIHVDEADAARARELLAQVADGSLALPEDADDMPGPDRDDGSDEPDRW